MSMHVALHHETKYSYDRLVTLTPHVIRLRPAPHCRTPILSYDLRIGPKAHFLNWQQDPYNNYLARLVFPEPTRELHVEVDLIAELTVINPFDFYVEDYAETYPFQYAKEVTHELAAYLEKETLTPKLAAIVEEYRGVAREMGSEDIKADDHSALRTVDFLVALNQRLNQRIEYIIRKEPGLQTCEETLTLGRGACRDTSWLEVQILRNLGFAARFVSGYSIQLKADVKPLEGPYGVDHDLTDLHAWTEVYIPGAGWIGMDPTSGMMATEGHIPLACAAHPLTAAPISGAFNPTYSSEPNEKVETQFFFDMSVRRVFETPRVTKPYTEQQWEKIVDLGHQLDEELEREDVRLTMGGEPTFVSVDDMQGDEWNYNALGPTKRILAGKLLRRLHTKFAPGGVLHYGQGKWYPGEPLPRWQLDCYWRRDGVPVWEDVELMATEGHNYGHDDSSANRFIRKLAENLHVNSDNTMAGYEDVYYYLWKQRRLPTNVDPLESKLDDPLERERLARIFEQGLGQVIGYALPLDRRIVEGLPTWVSGRWFFRPERMYLLPGDSPMGLRLPLDSLPWVAPELASSVQDFDPSQVHTILARAGRNAEYDHRRGRQVRMQPYPEGRNPAWRTTGVLPNGRWGVADQMLDGYPDEPFSDVIRTALCVEPREGHLFVFLPPTRRLEDYLDLVRVIEETANELDLPLLLEGYPPPSDPRLNSFSVTPDPGVIEVNIHPSHNWDELTKKTEMLYEEARQCRLGCEKFMLDGRHTGTGGGNHIILGGPTPTDSPLLRRPDLLKSLVSYWHNHPSLSYLFSGLFLGPTSQAPRVDEARNDSLYELEIAFDQVPDGGYLPPWLTDRLFRNLLIDVTGNTHRAEFCIDKLYSPDSHGGRRGLLEMRAFEMPPHPRMNLAQQLLLRSLVARFWKQPYQTKLVRWGTELHDRFCLPHFIWQDFQDVITEMRYAGYPLQTEWFTPHLEFRFPFVGNVARRDCVLELRHAIELWHVLGEEVGAQSTARYVDSSVERLQCKVQGIIPDRHVVLCNGHRVPLHPTGTNGEYVAGVRYRAWQPPSCLHPTIPVQAPLVFDLVDTWMNWSMGGCTYHVEHPGGRNTDLFPVNAYEAEARRASRFFQMGHTQGPIEAPPETRNPEAPLTLDLRRVHSLEPFNPAERNPQRESPKIIQ
ncbi:MAG: DUF2126 domain-containing protein [Gemmataceae bacterium]